MKIVLSVMLGISLIVSILFGMAFAGAESDLDQTKSQLSGLQTELAAAQTQLADTNIQLEKAQKDLINTEDALDTANEDLRSAETELAATKFDLIDITHERDAEVAQNNKMFTAYTLIKNQIYERLGHREESEKYITPKDTAVLAKVQEIAGSYSEDSSEMWRDYQRMYQWIIDNIEYSFDTNLPILPETPDGELQWLAEYWKMPSETIKDLNGDCEDMANLLSSLMLGYNNQKYAAWVLIIRDKDGNGHVAVAIPIKGDMLVIYDPAGNYYSGDALGYVQSVSISSAVNTWLSHWSNKMPGAKITAAYSTDFYKTFDNTQEFIQWATDEYD